MVVTLWIVQGAVDSHDNPTVDIPHCVLMETLDDCVSSARAVVKYTDDIIMQDEHMSLCCVVINMTTKSNWLDY